MKRLRWLLTGCAILLGVIVIACMIVRPAGWEKWGDGFIYGAVSVAVVAGLLWHGV